MPLYEIQSNDKVSQIKPTSFTSEKVLQKLFEENLEKLLGVRFIASEFTTGDRQRGRIDSLGIDQDGTPTIIEYKKSSKENIINQGLFYLDWLVDHKGDFTIAAQEVLGSEFEINWSQPRLILIAETFSEYDKYAVNRIGANIELWAYHRYGENFLYLDPIFITNPKAIKTTKTLKISTTEEETETPIYTLDDHLAGKNETIRELFEQLRENIFALTDDNSIIEKANKMYISYKHGKNFCEIRIQSKALWIWLDSFQAELDDPYQLTRDVTNIGHYGTGQVDLKLTTASDMSKVLNLIEQSFRQTI